MKEVNEQLKKSRTIKAGAIGTISLALAVAVEQVAAIQEILIPYPQISEYASTALVILGIASQLVAVWARIDDAIKGVR